MLEIKFGNQAPGTDDEIHEFCALKYNTSFYQFTKIEVNGENESPLYTLLKETLADDTIDEFKKTIKLNN